MILGLGIDVTELDRIGRSYERFGERFVRKVLSPEEQAIMPKKNPVPFLAAQFAGKEAASKALGTGLRRGVTLPCLVIGREPSGKPVLTLTGEAARVAEDMGVKSCHVSLTHGRDTAAAVVVVEG